MISSIILLYRDALTQTGAALARSALMWPLPVVILVLLQLAWVPLGALGIIGGLVHFVLESLLYGAYLYLLGESLSRRTRIKPADLRDAMGRNMREVMSLLFVIWILQLALQMASSNGQISGHVSFVVILAASVLFNPGPEIICHERSLGGGMDILVQSFRWVSSNGPEWLINLVLTAAFIIALGSGNVGILTLIVVGLCLHPWMLFRGAVYRAIGNTSRRSRDWQSRF